jgi:hypothetical protein
MVSCMLRLSRFAGWSQIMTGVMKQLLQANMSPTATTL